MTEEDLKKAKENRERLPVTYPDVREETEESRKTNKKSTLQRRYSMADKGKGKKQEEGQAVVVETAAPAPKKKAKGAKYPDKNSPPAVEAGYRAVWHEPYSYENSKGTTIAIAGHYEVIKEAAKKPAAPVAEAKTEEAVS